MKKKGVDLIVDKIKDLQFYQKETKKDLKCVIKKLNKAQDKMADKFQLYVENHAKHHTKLLMFLVAIGISFCSLIIAFNPAILPFFAKVFIGIF